MQKLLLVASCVLLASCAHTREAGYREKVREGMLTTGLSEAAFHDVWGNPDRVAVSAGDQVGNAAAGTFSSGYAGGTAFTPRDNYELWFYDGRRTVLVFGKDKHLFAWRTELTVNQLAAPRTDGK